jgi:FAD/FMN-containing dehydrogenase
MLTRRQLIHRAAGAGTAALALPSLKPSLLRAGDENAEGVVLNDVQSRLNATRVRRVIEPDSLDVVSAAIRAAADEGQPISVSGGRHAMGGQQFAKDAVHLDLAARLNRVLSFDADKGLIEVEGGIMWPALLEYLHTTQEGKPKQWSIRQKQTGVDRVTLAGTVSANAHGRGLAFKPFIDDVESFVLVGADGEPRTCSRAENRELFCLATGGYGLFGVIARITLRLVPRQKVQRVVKVIPLRELTASVEQRVKDGFLYGDCQYSTDFESNPDAPHLGVFSCYKPVPDDTPVAAGQRKLTEKDWAGLHYLAHTDHAKVFKLYADYYLSTDGQVYWSDTHQLSTLTPGYHDTLDKMLPPGPRGSDVITEVYVTPDKLMPFLVAAKKLVRERRMNLIYGTVRFMEKDDECFLAAAKDKCVSVLCNLHVTHTPEGLEKAGDDFRGLIGLAGDFGGRYFLTYHRWATREQVTRCYPQFVKFLKLKKKYDPQERLQSEWYRHYREMFADEL